MSTVHHITGRSRCQGLRYLARTLRMLAEDDRDATQQRVHENREIRRYVPAGHAATEWDDEEERR